MINYFLDSSAIVKKYVVEAGSAWIRTITSSAQTRIFIARIAWVEGVSALSRLEREGKVPLTVVEMAVQLFRYDFEMLYQIIELQDVVADAAGQLVRKHPLRAYDAVQLASALHLLPIFSKSSSDSFTFVSADKRLLAIAQLVGLETADPNLYP